MELRWKASLSASCLHAAASMSEGLPIADTDTAALLEPAVTQLLQTLQACGLAREALLPRLVDLAADWENNRQLAERAIQRLHGPGTVASSDIPRLAGAIADLEAVMLHQRPELVEELAVRGGPIREQWEARGPGLLQAIRHLAGEDFVADSAEVILVRPIVGGHGRPHLSSNRVTLEAVLTHPHPDLPEPLRLGWLLAQLNLDLPALSEPVPGQRLPALAGLAAVPLVLAAAETVELAGLTQSSLQQALRSWHLSASLPADTAERLHSWWQAYLGGNRRWPVALAALDALLPVGNQA